MKLGFAFLAGATIILVVVAKARHEHYSFMFPVPLEPTLDILSHYHLCPLCTHIFRAVDLRTSVGGRRGRKATSRLK